MTIDVYPPDKRKRDLDNICKNLLDSLQKAQIYPDDNQIDLLIIQRKEVVKGGKLHVSISTI